MNIDFRIINTHAHLHTDSNVDRLVDEWRASGVVKCCVLALGEKGKEVGYMGNAGVKKWMDEYPDIIVGMGHIESGPFMDPYSKVDRLHADGFKGLKFISPAYAYSDRRYFGYYERAQELGMPIIFHTGWVGALDRETETWVNSEYMRPYHFDVICRSFPELKIIGAHLGNPHRNEALCLCTRFDNLYFDLCGGGGSMAHVSNLKRDLAPFPGADWDNPEENLAKTYFKKFVFATDNPPVNKCKQNSEILMDYLHIDQETRKDFYWRNAAGIFGWPALL